MREENKASIAPKAFRLFQANAHKAWSALPKEKRIRIKRKYKARREHFTETDWFRKITEATRVDGAQQEDRAHRKGARAKTVTLTISSDPKRLDKHVRAALKLPAPPKNPYAALMQPMVIVPDNPAEKPVIADAGSIVRFADQSGLYRAFTSPVTRRADEILVHYGNAKKPLLGWLAHKLSVPSKKAMKPSRGPTFLVTTKAEDSVSAWDQLRLLLARTRKTDPSNWLAPWLAGHGAKHPRELREVTRLFGGTPIKNESTDVRIERLFQLILHTELDMATAKRNKKSKKSKKHSQSDDREEKSTKKSSAKSSKKRAKKSRVGKDRVGKDQDAYVIKRLVKENPRRAGSEKAKIWARLKKGMTVAEFIEKGGSRGAVKLYVESGWAKLLRPRGE